MRVFIGILVFAIVAGLIGWAKQDYLRDQVRQFVTIRPYIDKQVRPYVLTAAGERALKPGNSFKECPKNCPEMVVVPAGQFVMGPSANEKGRLRNEGPQHTVTIARPFAVSKFELTFDEWDACVTYGDCEPLVNDNGWGRGRRPVINVTWDDARRYAAWLSKMTGKTYRLLSEAEWEYAARAGSNKAYSWGDEIGKGNANCNGSTQTAPVGSFPANQMFGSGSRIAGTALTKERSPVTKERPRTAQRGLQAGSVLSVLSEAVPGTTIPRAFALPVAEACPSPRSMTWASVSAGRCPRHEVDAL